MIRPYFVFFGVLLLATSSEASNKSGTVSSEAHGKTAVLHCSSPNVIRVTSATYGKNQGVTAGNVTTKVASTCDNLSRCDYPINVSTLGDPTPGKRKNFVYLYQCNAASSTKSAKLPPEASGKTLQVACSTGYVARIQSAMYGANCTRSPKNATTQLVAACDKKTSCSYRVSHVTLGDPAPGCAKDFKATFTCERQTTPSLYGGPSSSKVDTQYPFAVGNGGVGAKNVNVCVCNGSNGCNAGNHWYAKGTHLGMSISDTLAKQATAANTGSLWYCFKPTSSPERIGSRGSDSTIQTACTCVGKRSNFSSCGAALRGQSIVGGALNNYKQGLSVSKANTSYAGKDASGNATQTGWLCGPHLGDSSTFQGTSRNFDNSISPSAK